MALSFFIDTKEPMKSHQSPSLLGNCARGLPEQLLRRQTTTVSNLGAFGAFGASLLFALISICQRMALSCGLRIVLPNHVKQRSSVSKDSLHDVTTQTRLAR